MPLIDLGKFDNTISKSVEVADLGNGAEANYYGALANLGERAAGLGIDLYKKRMSIKRKAATDEALKLMLRDYTKLEETLNTPEMKATLERTGGYLPKDVTGKDEPMQYDVYMNDYLDNYRLKTTKNLSNLVDEEAAAMFNGYANDFQMRTIPKNIGKSSEFANASVARASSEVLKEQKDTIYNTADTKNLVGKANMMFEMNNISYLKDADVDPSAAIFAQEARHKNLASSMYDRVKLLLTEPSSYQDGMKAATSMLGTEFNMVRDPSKGKLIMTRKSFDKMKEFSMEDLGDITVLQEQLNAEVIDEVEFEREYGKVSTPPWMEYLDPEKKLDLMNTIMRQTIEIEKKKSSDLDIRVKNIIDPIGMPNVSTNERMQLYKTLIENNPGVYSAEQKIKHIEQAAANNIANKLVANRMINPDTIMGNMKNTDMFIMEAVKEMAGSDPEVVALLPEQIAGMRKEIWGTLKERQESIARSMYRDPHGFMYSTQPEIRALRAGVFNKDGTLNFKNLESYTNLTRTKMQQMGVDISRSKQYPAELISELGNRLKESIELKDGGTFARSLEQSTKQDPYLMIQTVESLKAKGVLNEEQAGALIYSNLGNGDPNGQKLRESLRIFEKQNLTVIAEQAKAKGLEISDNDVASATAPYVSGLSSGIQSTDKVAFINGLNKHIKNMALANLVENPKLSKSEAIARAIESTYGNVRTFEYDTFKGVSTKNNQIQSSAIEKWSKDEIKNIVKNLETGKIKIKYDSYPKFMQQWGGAIIKSDPSEMNKKFLDQIKDLRFVNTDPTGKTEEFLLMGTMGSGEEILIILENNKKQGVPLKAPPIDQMFIDKQRGPYRLDMIDTSIKTKRGPSSIESTPTEMLMQGMRNGR